MFKIPDWDCDTPKDIITELFKRNNKKSKKSVKNKSNTTVNDYIDSKKLKIANGKTDNHKNSKIVENNQNKINGDTSSLKVTNRPSYGKIVINPFTSTTDAKIAKTHKNKKKKLKNNLTKPKVSLPSRKYKHDSITVKTPEANKGIDLQDYSSDKPNVINPFTSITNGKITKTHKNKKHENNLTDPKVITLSSRKRKHDSITVKTPEADKSIDLQEYSSDKPDEVLINATKKRFVEKLTTEDREHLLLSNVIDEVDEDKQNPKNVMNDEDSGTVLDKVSQSQKRNGFNAFKKKLKHLLDNKESENRNTIKVTGNKLRERMLEKLRAAQFRYLNEKLYTSSGTEAQKLFQGDPSAFQVYHEGYQQQVKKWPVKPLDVIVTKIKKMPKSHVIADMGCGEATLSQRVPHTVHSFDLVATAPSVVACDMAHTPLRAASVDAVVYCLALMGTDLTKYLIEANRVMKSGGQLLIAEVESRFENIDNFIKDVERLGFKLKKLDKSNTVFYFMEFTKIRDLPVKKNKLPALTLKPCLYKKR